MMRELERGKRRWVEVGAVTKGYEILGCEDGVAGLPGVWRVHWHGAHAVLAPMVFVREDGIWRTARRWAQLQGLELLALASEYPRLPGQWARMIGEVRKI